MEKTIHKIIIHSLPLIALLFFGVFATLPFYRSTFIPTHDGEYNIIRFMEFFRMLQEGVWFPQWAPTVNSGYGMPIFIFYYPFPNYVGAFFHLLGWNFVESVKLTLASGYLISLVFCFLWIKKIFGTKPAFVASVMCAYIPYWFVELYVRGSVPEVIALAFVFISLYCIEARKKLFVASSICLLILSHNILALLFIPFLFIYSLIRNKASILYLLFGIGGASYFWIPALAEKQYVTGLNTVNFRDHFAQLYELLIPSWGTAFSATGGIGNKISFQIGVIPFLLIILSVVLFVSKPSGGNRRLVGFMFITLVLSLFLTLPQSLFVWEMLPILQFTQYPWRFLVFLLPVIPFITAWLMSRLQKSWIVAVIVCTGIVLAVPYARPVVYELRDDAYYASRNNFTDGTVSMGNSFSTIWSSWKNERPKERIRIQNGKLKEYFKKNSYLEKEFTVIATNSTNITLPILYFPGWTARVDGKSTPIQYKDKGIISFSVPQGEHTVTVKFQNTPIRMLSTIVSILSFIAVFFVPRGQWNIIQTVTHKRKHS